MSTASLTDPYERASRTYARGSIVLPAIAAIGLTVVLVALSLSRTSETDYLIESQPAFEALRHGHVGLFLDRSPAYAGSLILRAPLALLPNLWGGGSLAVFRAVSAPAVILLFAGSIVAWAVTLRVTGRRGAAWIGLLLVLASPLNVYALGSGHSEEILVTFACIAAAFAAAHRRAGIAGLLFGIAVASKPWAVVAAGPLLLALDAGRVRFVTVAGVVAAAILAPFVLHGGESVTTATTIAHSTGTIANPWQVWWFFGDHAGPVVRTFGHVHNDYRVEPDWVVRASHPLVVAVPAAICLAQPRMLKGRPWHDVLLLLAAAFFLRCVLDTWNHHYYALPAALALGTWEVLARHRAPFAGWALTLLTFASIVLIPGLASADAESIVYLAWALPFLAGLLLASLAPVRWNSLVRRVASVRG